MSSPSTISTNTTSLAEGTLVSHLGINIISVQRGQSHLELPIQPFLLAPNGYLHAGSVISLADSAAGFGCMASLPEGASGFTTIEIKSNHLGTARDGELVCTATVVHAGKSTQVWDAIVKNKATDQTIALFRCTQMILYPKK
ncbi:PaaI family thioesterase [Sapientia aquatica]|uniref:PaaI family thioesterase n=1 Tax=Sapientia aquatica TaxID=1549640 RepID=A0A4R5W512_9BURK|nr:PaaI family thioesterase [Sapientia aquatica]TDK68197.1 PaaI family thioesterase [Sapientia aquatica]